MPITKEKQKLYPKNWKEISKKRRARANNKCEFCGAVNYELHPETGSRVILTVAHLDHDPGNNSDDNLRALCQRCHLTYDAKHHAENARRTRDAKNGIMSLPFA